MTASPFSENFPKQPTDPLRYRPCVGVCLFNKEGLVFVGERLDTPQAWQMPQGGVDEGEDIETAARRELAEETGINKYSHIALIRIHPHPIRYTLPDNIRARVDWGASYAGQEQTWVAFRFLGEESSIRLDAWEHPEFGRWRWVPLAQVPELIVPFKRAVYQDVARAFADIAVL